MLVSDVRMMEPDLTQSVPNNLEIDSPSDSGNQGNKRNIFMGFRNSHNYASVPDDSISPSIGFVRTSQMNMYNNNNHPTSARHSYSFASDSSGKCYYFLRYYILLLFQHNLISSWWNRQWRELFGLPPANGEAPTITHWSRLHRLGRRNSYRRSSLCASIWWAIFHHCSRESVILLGKLILKYALNS